MNHFRRNLVRIHPLLLSHLNKQGHTIEILAPITSNDCFMRCFANKENFAQKNTSKTLKSEGKDGKKVAEKITLINVDNSITITTMEDAQKIAKRRELKIIKDDQDKKALRPVYRLTTTSRITAEAKREISQNVDTNKFQVKGEKLLNVTNKIAEQDLQSRLKQLQKWLSKHHKVIVVISGASSTDIGSSERIFKSIEEISKGLGNIYQKRVKNSDIKFQIMPIQQPGETPKA